MNDRHDKKINIRLAVPGDLPAVRTLYKQLCEQQKLDGWGPKWIYGIYPCDRDFEARIQANELYLLEKEGRIASGFVLQKDPDNALSLHLFGVLPQFRRQGLARQVVQFLEQKALEEGCLTLTLDVIADNYPAQKLYESMGFIFCGTHEMMEEGNGLLHFRDYRKDLFRK